MLIESIEITNFLPFKEKQFVEFSVDPEKNITIIMGDNGSGKTALAQAFEWCLYGKTSYKNNFLLNAEVMETLSPGSYTYVIVEICLNHEDISYTITRKQKYERRDNGEMAKPGEVDFSILYKDKGESKQVALTDQTATINKLLSSELSRYFFFDGEHVKSMREEIEAGKSKEFAEAVKSILGLRHIANALDHLKVGDSRKKSVEKILRDQYSVDGDNTIDENSKKIKSLSKEIDKLEDDILDLQAEEDAASERSKKYESLLEQNENSEQAIKGVKRAEDQLEAQQKSYKDNLYSIFDLFKKQQYRFFSDCLMTDAQQELSDEEKIEKGVPGVTKETIDFLLNNGSCICGTKLENGSEAAAKLYELVNYIPPKSMGTSISDFVTSCETRKEQSNDLGIEIDQAYSVYRNSQKGIEQAEKALESAKEYLASLNQVDVKDFRKNFNQAKQDMLSAREQLGVKRHRKLQCENEIDDLNNQIDIIAKNSNQNKEIAMCLAYVDCIYDYFYNYYSQREKSVKQMLELEVNNIFKEIYNGELYLEFDGNYNITVRVNGVSSLNERWETSSAQTLAIILAFIAGILKISRENIESGDELAQGSTYPLVMDAPLSDFDTTRIKSICTVLPVIAEQVIILIKDTDGNLAEENLGSKIGRRYVIDKLSDYHSVIKEG